MAENSIDNYYRNKSELFHPLAGSLQQQEQDVSVVGMMNCGDVYALLGDEGQEPVSLDGSVVSSSPRCPSPPLMTGLESISPSLNIKLEPNITVGSTAPTQTTTGGNCSNVSFNSNNVNNNNNNNNSNYGNNNINNNNNPGGQVAGVSMLRVGTRRTDESSEYNYAKALLDQASSFATSPDLDRSSVLRLAQAYINLQQGLQSWENCGHRLELWPPLVHAGRLALNAQKSLGCFVLIVTGHGTVVYVSDAIETLLGHDQINLVGRSIQNLIHPEEMSVLATQFSLVTGAGQVPSSRSFYTRMLNAEKSNASRQVFELVHVIGHLQEVALASSSDRSMDQKETWLMCACKVMAHVPEKEGPCSPYVEWVTHNELNGKIIDIDPRSCQVTGYLPSEMVGLSPYCFIHADDQEHVAFFHNQALFDAEGASTYYRMYTSSHDIVFVHTTMQLSTDKLTNRPKSLFCIHQVVGEKEGSDQILQHQQLVMWSKADPSSKFSMADIEHMVKALEERGVASRNIPSKGGMMNSRLTDSCTLDGADLLNRNLSQILTVPSFSENVNTGETVMSHGMRQSGRGHGRTPYARMNSPYHHRSQQQMQQQQQQQQLQQQQQQQQQQHQNLYSPISPIGSVGSSSSIGDPWSGKSQQRSQKGYRHHQMHQQPSMVSPTQSRPAFQRQMSFSSASPLSAGGSTPHPESPVSFIDFLSESGPQSTPTPDPKSLYSDMPAASSLAVGGRGRGRGRSRGRPRGSGRGARGLSRGAGRPRGTRGRGRGRGRGNSESLAQLRDVMGNVQKMNTNIGHGSISPGRGRAHQGMPHMRHSLSADMSTEISSQMLPNPGMPQGDINPQARASPFHSLLGEDEGLLKRNSLDDLDFLDTKGSFEMQHIPNMELMSPVSLSSQDSAPNMQISPYQSYNNETDIKDGGQHAYRKHSIGAPDMQQPGMYFQEPKMSSFDISMSTNSQYSSQTSMTSSVSTGRRRGQLQHSLSLQGPLETQIGQESDVEHSILGNLLKGRGGSTSTAGSKSPIQSLGLDKGTSSPSQALQSNRWSPSQAGGGNKAKWIVNSMSADRDGKSFSEASSPASVFSPEASVSTPTTPKGGRSPHLGSSSKMSHHTGPSVQKASPLQCDNMTPPGEPGMSKAMAEMQVFSAQLRHKHKTLEHNFVFQEKVLRHLESNMQQASTEMDRESFYAQLNARLDNIKVNTMAKKAKQEEELRSIQAKFESQVKAHATEPQQHQPQQMTSNAQPQQPGTLSSNPVDTQPRLHLTTPASQNHRRMAIVPPIQRQVTEEETTSLTQSSATDLKSSSGLDSQCSKESRLETLSPPPGSKGSDNFSKMKKQHQHTSAVATSMGVSSSLATAMVNQVPQPQPSPYSLHHHHHHHHHYHHQMPILPGQPPPPPPRAGHSQQALEFPRAGKVTPPPPPYGHMDIFPPVSSAAMPSPATSLAQTALNISVPSLSTSLTSPIVCDTSPISVDESPSCASDTSSGYHSLSLSTDPASVSAAGSFTKPHEGTSVVSGILFQSKTPPTSTFHAKMGTTPELLSGNGDFNPSASS